MKQIEQLIFPLVKTHFPDFYQDEGPRFIDFVQEYYRWMSSEGEALNASRNLLDYRNIDTTSEDFIKYFKNKYFAGIPVSSEANTRFLVKHAGDIYGSKGTTRGVQLVLQGLFNQESTVYFPAEDLFKASDGTWVKPSYLELSVSQRTTAFVGKEIIGSQSGAKAFLESLVRRRVNGRFIEVAYLSNVRGNFETGELITSTVDTNLEDAPIVTGSMSDLTVVLGGAEFAVGDIFDVVSSNGKQGKARVTEISNETGKVNFIFIDAIESGGWGYSTAHANVIVSSKVLTLQDVLNANANITTFSRFEAVQQSLVNVAYSTARGNNFYFEAGNILQNFNSNGTVNAEAVIVTSTKTNNSSGYVVVSPISGNLAVVDTTFAVYTSNTSNTSFNPSLITGNVITTTASHSFSNGDLVRYEVLTGNTVVTGMSTGAAYYIVNTTSGSSALSLTDTLGGAPITPTAGLNQTGHKLIKTLGTAVITSYSDRTATGNVVGSNTTFVTASFNALNGVANATDIITTLSPHGLTNNSIIRYIAGAGNTAISGLTSNSEYYVINTSASALQLALTRNGNPINITSGTSETGHHLVYETGYLGLTDLTANGFIATPYANVVGLTTNTHATVANVSTGSGANFNIGALTYTENVFLSPDFLSSKNSGNVVFHSVRLDHSNSNATGLGFLKHPGATINTILLDALRFDATTIGSIAAITSINPGSNYNIDPFVAVVDTYVAGYGKLDYRMRIDNVVGAFIENEQIQQTYTSPATQLTVNTFSGTYANGDIASTFVQGEFVYQSNNTVNVVASGYVLEAGVSGGSGTVKLGNVTGTFVVTTNANTKLKGLSSGSLSNVQATSLTTVATTARAIVKPGSNSSVLLLKRINLENTFLTTTAIIGRSSSATANVVAIDMDQTTIPVGLNADIAANVQTANNVVKKLSVADSGFGYIQNETVTLSKEGSNFVVTAIVGLGKQGVGSGFYSSTRGFLDADKRIQDNEYYQEYSYEVQTKIPFDKYFDVLKQVTHVAGTKAFGKVTSLSVANVSMSVINSIEIS